MKWCLCLSSNGPFQFFTVIAVFFTLAVAAQGGANIRAISALFQFLIILITLVKVKNYQTHKSIDVQKITKQSKTKAQSHDSFVTCQIKEILTK